MIRRSRWCVDSCGFSCRLLSRVFRPTSTISLGVPGLSLPSTILSVLIPIFDHVLAPIPVLVPVPVLDLVPVHIPVTVFSLLSLGPGLLAACEMTVPDFLRVFPGVANFRALLPPPPSPLPFSFPFPSPLLSLFPPPSLSPLLPSLPFPLSSPSPSYVPFLVSTPVLFVILAYFVSG